MANRHSRPAFRPSSFKRPRQRLHCVNRVRRVHREWRGGAGRVRARGPLWYRPAAAADERKGPKDEHRKRRLSYLVRVCSGKSCALNRGGQPERGGEGVSTHGFAARGRAFGSKKQESRGREKHPGRAEGARGRGRPRGRGAGRPGRKGEERLQGGRRGRGDAGPHRRRAHAFGRPLASQGASAGALAPTTMRRLPPPLLGATSAAAATLTAPAPLALGRLPAVVGAARCAEERAREC
jgi:hypothetical protein